MRRTKFSFNVLLLCCYVLHNSQCETADTIEDMAIYYEDDKNSMIAVSETERTDIYDESYHEMDNRFRIVQSMNILFFGPPNSFLRLDAESVLHILTYTKKHLLPISRTILIWDILTDGKSAAYLQGREYLALGSLLNVVPEEDLYDVNFGNPSVINYFANHYIQLLPRKYGILAAAYKRYYGDNWYENSTYINQLGYLICGFPSNDLRKISPSVFKELNQNTLSKTLYRIATHRDAYGEPYKWSSHEVGRLCTLFKCIPQKDISSIQLEAITALTPEVINKISQDKLKFFTKQQVLRMNPKTRRLYILRIQLMNSYDMKDISNRQFSTQKKPFLTTVLNIVILGYVISRAINYWSLSY